MDNQKNLQPVNLKLVQANYIADEISLNDILRIFVRNKRVTIFSILVFTIIALLYAYLSPSLYKATAYLLPPSQYDVEKFNIEAGSIRISYSASDVFSIFLQNLESYSQSNILVKKYLETNKLSNLKGKPLEIFKFLEVEKKGEKILEVSLALSDAGRAATVLNSYIDFVNDETIFELKKNIRDRINIKVDRLQFDISYLADKQSLQSKDKLDQLAEENRIEEILEIKKLEEYEHELAKLNFVLGQIADDSIFKVMLVDLYAEIPDKVFKPNRVFIIFAGAISGLLFGLFLALIINFVREFNEGSA